MNRSYPYSGSYEIPDRWDSIPLVDDLEKGLLLDGYHARNHAGFNCIFYDPQTGRLVRWLDPTGYPKARYLGNVPATASELPISIMELHDLLEDKPVTVSEVAVTNVGHRKNTKVKEAKTPRIDKACPMELQYFMDHSLTPGSWYAADTTGLRLLLQSEKDLSQVESKLLGEPEGLVEHVRMNLPLLNSPTGYLHRVAFDIEVKSSRDTFPVPDKANYPVLAVGFYDSHDAAELYILGLPFTDEIINQACKTLGYAPQVTCFVMEEDLLNAVYAKLQQYPLLISYNGDYFDLPYLYHRGKKLGLNPPIGKGHQRGRSEWEVNGCLHIDLFKFFTNNAVRLYAFGGKYSRMRLDDVSEALLGSKKVEHETWFDEMDPDELIRYTITDVKLTLELTRFSNNLVLTLMILLMRVGKFTITYANRMSISRWILSWIVWEHRRIGAILPSKLAIRQSKGDFESASMGGDKQYMGAIVFDPPPGIFWDVLVADFASLYPSVIKKYNLSYETIRCKHEDCRNNIVPGLHHWVCTKRSGIMSTLVGYVRDVRVKWYKALSKNGTAEEKEFATTIQAALKVYINASYGVFGAQSFQFFCPPVAESVTAFARSALLGAKSLAESMGLRVLAGDTDSIFIHKCTDDNFLDLKIWSVIKLGIELGIDYRFRFLVLSGRKKNYFGVTRASKLIVKGLRVKKRNTSTFVKTTFDEIAEMMLAVQNQMQLDAAVLKMGQIIKSKVAALQRQQISMTDLGTLYTLSKPLEEYTAATPAVQVALQVAGSAASEVTEGSQFIALSTKPRQIAVRTKLFANIPLGQIMMVKFTSIDQVAGWHEIDTEKYIESLRKSFKPIFDAFSISWDELIHPTPKLDTYFQETRISVKKPIGLETYTK